MSTALIKKLENFILFIAKKYNVIDRQDFKQDVLLLLLQKGENFIQDLENENSLKRYVYKVCLFQIISERSKYKKQYEVPSHFKDLSEVHNYKNTCFKDEVLNDLINSLTGTDKLLIEHLLLCRGVKSCLSKKSDISNSSLNLMVEDLSERIKKNWQLNEFYG